MVKNKFYFIYIYIYSYKIVLVRFHEESSVRSNESIGWWEVLERQDVRRHIAATQIVIIPSAKLLSMETLLRVMEDEEEWPYTTYICLNLGLCVYIIIRGNFYESFGSATFLLWSSFRLFPACLMVIQRIHGCARIVRIYSST